MGVTFVTGTDIGKDIKASKLLHDFAVSNPHKLNIGGAIFLKQKNVETLVGVNALMRPTSLPSPAETSAQRSTVRASTPTAPFP